jgi:hypothetical protein
VRAFLEDIRTLYDERDPEFLQTLQLVREITKEMEAPPFQDAA